MGGKKGRQATNKTLKSDFTLNDFANATSEVVKTGRLKKGETKFVQTSEMAVCKTSSTTDLEWFEKDLSDFEITDFPAALSDAEKENVDCGASVRSRTRRRKKKQLENLIMKDESGYIYPLDLWFILGSYIDPEDISLFARICKSAHIVIHSAMFWHELYKRYFNADIDLPMHLQPHCISHNHGLRTRVVRSLFYLYPAFQRRVKNTASFGHDPDVLTGARCLLMWHKQVKNLWHFFFKFRLPRRSQCHLSAVVGDNEDRLLSDINIHDNTEEDCCVLQVLATNYICMPVVMGLILTKTFLSVSGDMRHHRLKLVFSEQHQYSPHDRNLAGATTLVLDPVYNVYVLRWWHPKYPHHSPEVFDCASEG
jgi:hypothetical protein